MSVILKGSTDVTRYVMLVDSTAGTPETGYTITSLDLQYTRNRVAPAAKADATALAATDSSHADNKAIEVDATSSPGLYRVDWPDAAFATGVDKVLLVVSGTGLHPATEEIQLVDYNPEDAVRLGLTALPAAVPGQAGGLFIAGTNAATTVTTALTTTFTGSLTGSVASVTGAVGSVAANGISASSLAADAVDEIWDEVMEGTTTARHSMKLANSANAGKLSGAATTTVVVRDIGDTKDRITATVDADGNRSAITVDAT